MKAVWNGAMLAESDDTIVAEGNHYFPPSAVHTQYIEDSTTHTTCSWEGEASHYHVIANGKKNRDAAWFYPDPKEAASQIRDYVAFWKGVEIISQAYRARDVGRQQPCRQRPLPG